MKTYLYISCTFGLVGNTMAILFIVVLLACITCELMRMK